MAHPLVLFVAQNPKTERNVAEPLAGTRSHRTFKAWVKLLGEPDYVLLNASDRIGKVTWRDYNPVPVSQALAVCDRYVALGLYASGLLERLGVRHFTLPHPSGLNRKLNDREELQQRLRLCRLYLGTRRQT